MKAVETLLILAIGIAWTALWVWLVVVAIQYLRIVTKAAHRYLDLTADKAYQQHYEAVPAQANETLPAADGGGQ
jgi:hypothetical protein